MMKEVFNLKHRFVLPLYIAALFLLSFGIVSAQEPSENEQRMRYFLQFQNETIPWYYLAAVDQFERNIQQVRSDIPKKDGVISINFSLEFWTGPVNPNATDTSPESIAFFEGNGLDGNNDGIADQNSAEDSLFTMTSYLTSYGPSSDDFKLALWEYYKREATVNQIMTIATMYEHFETIDLDEHAFPIPVQFNYSYKGTWGANRGWGGRRIHEGTDLFASYGVPVLATSYGVIEVMGWNEYGGWRIGIRDNHNTYHYFAHLGYYTKGLKAGDIVQPGDTIGYVGSSGYGKEGTSGRFAPHLHYGMYKYNGRTEWAFDPYPSLRNWERESKN